ncbi:hypothetical protein BDQ17DRAFT_1382581 [Cyathus striatus]|nr:hypothetical protein BDQ17DRAFT_1382581 [Cyathus striatus]
MHRAHSRLIHTCHRLTAHRALRICSAPWLCAAPLYFVQLTWWNTGDGVISVVTWISFGAIATLCGVTRVCIWPGTLSGIGSRDLVVRSVTISTIPSIAHWWISCGIVGIGANTSLTGCIFPKAKIRLTVAICGRSSGARKSLFTWLST